MNFSIEKATQENLEEILDLFENSIKKCCAKDYDESQILAWVSSIEDKNRWKTKIEQQYFIVIKTQNTIVGFGSLEKNYIDLLYVHRLFLIKGIASLIYQSLKVKSENSGFRSLLTHASKTAVPFFKSKGFRIIKENKVFKKEIEITNFEMTQKRENE